MKLINFNKNNIDKAINELVIDKNTNEPIIIIHDLNKENTKDETSLKIKIKENINASFIEVFINSKEQKKEHSFKREFEVEGNASLEYLKYQDISENTSLNVDSNITLKQNAKINITNFELGLGINKNNFNTNLDAENSNLNIFGLVKLYEKSNSNSIFNTVHNAKNCSSNVSYKHSLHDASKAIYEAKSIVNEEALYSKVLQNSNTILLSDDAVIFASPHLEINIDELEASHGATTGSLNKEQLLYLQARGIPLNKAYEMLLKAFENEVYDNIKDLKIKEFITKFKKSDYV